jgi:hypothetical protein
MATQYSMMVSQAFYPGLVFAFCDFTRTRSRLFTGARTVGSLVDGKIGESAVKWDDRMIYWIPGPQIEGVHPVLSQDLFDKDMYMLSTAKLYLSRRVR